MPHFRPDFTVCERMFLNSLYAFGDPLSESMSKPWLSSLIPKKGFDNIVLGFRTDDQF